jgi:hypothetical protein
MSIKIEVLILLAVTFVIRGCRTETPNERSIAYDTMSMIASLKTNWPGLSNIIARSEGPGTYPYLTNLAAVFHKAEQRWPTSAVDVAKFAARNNTPFRRKDYPNLKFVADTPKGELKMSYTHAHATLKLSVPAPVNTSDE